MWVSLATRKFDSTNVNRLKVHVIDPISKRAMCNRSLKPLFAANRDNTIEDVNCNRCKELATA
jgi:hypothetical protein